MMTNKQLIEKLIHNQMINNLSENGEKLYYLPMYNFFDFKHFFMMKIVDATCMSLKGN